VSKVLVVPHDDTPFFSEFHDGRFLSFAYAAIGCDLVERIRMTHDMDMWIDEEGLLTGQPYNMKANLILAPYYGGMINIVGTVIIAGVNADGDTVSIPAWFEKTANYYKEEK
jgi:hypothetical protein